ncbi:eukaryotic translation initiation factor 2d [Lichtheimia corymbifera JMRC:FSU:9682]|uniref:Eukaryotic translation initiation factor 2d n=1 Tax=Lichtheimia corymbifera JMRC:FSU:9682 TaxID=1263082 RepID=A0A068RPH1_9FUNG|nr:eukaryotic translation initiation factor 2d [Lichtheimia corymbifera JMRC:FSU:9682]
MFKKPLSQIKSFSPLRSSDRRRFQNDAYNAYPTLKEKCSQEGASPLMPDPLLSAKFSTSNNVNGIVHVANNKPLWLKLEGLPPIPTVYTLWEHPEALPMFYTVGPVIQKLIDGADLMIPGVFPGPDGTIPAVEKGDLVAITVRGYSYPLAVGTMALASKDIKVRSGMKGKAIYLIHVYHDALWAMGDKSDPPEMKALSDDEYEEEDEDSPQAKDEAEGLADNVEAQLSVQDAKIHEDTPQQQEDEKPKLSAAGR